MDPDLEFVLMVSGIHLLGLGVAAMLLWHFVHTDPDERRDGDSDGGGGGNVLPEPPVPVRPRGGGLPLPDAAPARVRLREPAKLGDLTPPPERRPAHEPDRPARPVRS